jgi:hypothetical protein
VLGGDTSGFPNGRRPIDDVVDITLRVAMGVLLSAIRWQLERPGSRLGCVAPAALHRWRGAESGQLPGHVPVPEYGARWLSHQRQRLEGIGHEIQTPPPTPPPTSTNMSLDTAQVLALAQATSETSSPFAVNGGAFSFTDTSETTAPISVTQ